MLTYTLIALAAAATTLIILVALDIKDRAVIIEWETPNDVEQDPKEDEIKQD